MLVRLQTFFLSTLAKLNLKNTQGKMKQTYDKNTKQRSFKSGDKVLADLPVPGSPFKLDILLSRRPVT